MPVLTTGIVRDCFYLLIFYSEKFSTWLWRLPFAVNVNLNLPNNTFQRLTFKLHYHTLWLDSEILIRYFKKRKKAAIFTVKLMWQFLGRDETISFPIFIVRSLWRSIYHQILQRQVAFHALSKSGKLSCCHCSIILTSFAINLETQYYINCQLPTWYIRIFCFVLGIYFGRLSQNIRTS